MSLRIICLASLLFAGSALWAIVGGQSLGTNAQTGSAPARSIEKATPQLNSAPEPSTENGYVGSDACKVCHAPIFEAWRSTRHSFSVLTGEEAHRAGYPLPASASHTAGREAIRTWDDVLFVFGGRKRIAYVDTTGHVQPTSFHHRRGGWSPFPAKAMECGPCHHTGFDRTRPNPRVPQVPGSWAELNIGCEACHGPGARHSKTYDRADIRVDASPRLCGTCHTRAGRVLPRDDDFHATHDDVQAWNEDPHVIAMKFRSHDMYCARCHSPYDRTALDSGAEATTPVFSEAKRNITCVSCHNPHALTDRAYRRDAVHLQAPRPARSHIFKGQDGDVTTENFLELNGRDAVCLQCHTGADRIDLDHADASCSDCHNTFRHNTSAETRVLADATHPDLSCRQCHRDADHLLTIVFRDPQALRASYVHNLATMPASFRSKYGFIYTARATAPPTAGTSASPSSSRVPYRDTTAPARVATTAPAPNDNPERAAKPPAPPALDFLSRGDHRRLSADAEIRKYQLAVQAQPESTDSYFDLASAYVARGEKDAAADVVGRALECPADEAVAGLAPLILRHQSLLVGMRSSPLPQPAARARLQTLAEAIGNAGLSAWLEGCLHLEQLQFAAAKVAFERAAAARPANQDLRFFKGLSNLGQGDPDAGIAELEAVLKQQPSHVSSRVALGIAYLEKRQFATAEKELRRAVNDDPRSGTAAYALAVGYLRQGLFPSAIDALQLCLRRDPDYVEAYFELARAHRLAGSAQDAIDVYGRLIARRPDLPDAHWELALLLKYLFDVTMFRMESLQGSAQTPAERLTRPAVLATFVQQATTYQQLALSELAITLRLRPGYPQALRHLADLYRRSGRLQDAVRLFQMLARTQPDDWLYHYRWGTTLIELGDYPGATEALTRASALAPSQGDIYVALGFAQLKSGAPDAAIELFDKATVYLPFSPGLFTNLGAAYASRGAFDVAKKHLRRAVELGTFPLPRLHLTFTNLGLAALKEGRAQEAMTALETALHLVPDYPRARDLVAKIRARSGERPEVWARDEPFLFNEMLEIFGEISTVNLDDDQ